MARINIENLGAAGLIRDIFNLDAPPEAWTTLRNCRMGPYGAERFLGHSKALGTSTGWTVAPYWLFHAPVAGGTGFWVGAGAEKVYARSAQSPYTETNITRQVAAADVDYAATETKKWNGGMFGGILVLNNGVDLPQFWSPVAGATKLQDLTNWPSAQRAAVMRPFGRFLVGVDILKTATRYPQLVKWSHAADPGAIPSSWDETNPAVYAGEYPLQDATGVIVDQRVLRDVNLLYTTDQVWQMRYVAGGDVFGFDPLLHEQGAMATHCIARFKHKTEMHLVLGGDDIFVHNGQSAQSVITPAMRRWFFQQIDATQFARSFVVANPVFSEIWICVPENGAEQPTLAAVWNWETGAVGFRDLLQETSGSDTRTTAATRGTPCIASGFIDDLTLETWDSDSGAWNTDTTVWDARTSSPAVPRLLMADRSAGKRTFLLDDESTFDGADFRWTAERVGLAIVGQDRQGNPKSDAEVFKLITEIWPKFEALAGTEIQVQVGVSDSPDVGVSWGDVETYVVGTTPFIPTYYSGRYISIRYTNLSDAALRLLGYGLEIDNIGKYN